MPRAHSTWYQSYGRQPNPNHDPDFNPTFTAFSEVDDEAVVAGELRRAFAFLRRHGDRRYSASSLMKLLTFADRLDCTDPTLTPEARPRVVTAVVPFHFDEETEVKSGGPVAIAVILPDGRMLMAVHQDKRRIGLGIALYGYINMYAYSAPQTWVHRENLVGQQFALAVGMKPWLINQNGAIQYCTSRPLVEDNDAVEYCDDSEIEMRMERAGRAPAQRPRRRVIPVAEQAWDVDGQRLLNTQDDVREWHPSEAARERAETRRAIDAANRNLLQVEQHLAVDRGHPDPQLERLLVEEEAIERRADAAARIAETYDFDDDNDPEF